MFISDFNIRIIVFKNNVIPDDNIYQQIYIYVKQIPFNDTRLSSDKPLT